MCSSDLAYSSLMATIEPFKTSPNCVSAARAASRALEPSGSSMLARSVPALRLCAAKKERLTFMPQVYVVQVSSVGDPVGCVVPESAFTTDSIRFNTSGLMLRKNEPARQLWLNAFNDVIEFRAFDLPPDIPVGLSDARGLRAFYDAGAVAQQGSVIRLEVRAVQK